ncbi:MAG: hypothetical protein A2X48_23085 [Lentisphaerae bacterium GWF2_49_21]|nr:MAG: hypothetical protein A2X48_23085 [Lentisphaerae bacterium GWF2_49_21]
MIQGDTFQKKGKYRIGALWGNNHRKLLDRLFLNRENTGMGHGGSAYEYCKIKMMVCFMSLPNAQAS